MGFDPIDPFSLHWDLLLTVLLLLHGTQQVHT